MAGDKGVGKIKLLFDYVITFYQNRIERPTNITRRMK